MAIMITVSICATSSIPKGVNAAYYKTFTTLETYNIGEKNHGYYLVPDMPGKYPVLFLFHGAGQYKVDADVYKYNALDTLNKWIALGYMDPMIVIMPEVEMETSDDSWAITGNQYFVSKGRFATLMEKVRSGYFTDKVDDTKKFSAGGFSMGGALSLYIGATYPNDVINIGAASPAWCLNRKSGDAEYGWMQKKNIHFPSDANTHLFIGNGVKEEAQFHENVARYLEIHEYGRGSNPHDFVVYNTYNDDHNWNTFKREIFYFLYYVKFDKTPTDEIIEEACKNTQLDYSTYDPSQDDENNQQNDPNGNSSQGNEENQQNQGENDQNTNNQTTDNNSQAGNNSYGNNNIDNNTGNNNNGSSNGNGNGYTDPSAPTYNSEWINGVWYNADGSLTYTGVGSWKSNETGWWYEDSLGWYPVACWQKIDGVWYYFNADGYCATNEWRDGYWLSSDGALTYTETASWKLYGSKWSYVDTSGWYPISRWQKIDSNWYYFDSEGYIVTNKKIDGYYLDANGVCQ